MSQLERVNEGKKKNGRGATNNQRRLAGLGSGGSRRTESHWGDVDPAWVAAFVVLLTEAGGAVMFGRSRDGAVLSVRVLMDGDAVTLWLDSGDETEVQLAALYEQLKVRLGD